MTARLIRTDAINKTRLRISQGIKKEILSWGLPQIKIAERLDTHRVRVNRIMLDKIDDISLEALLYYAELAGVEVSIVISDKPKHKTPKNRI
jgi:predicted XRE-type DNA-binding protein